MSALKIKNRHLVGLCNWLNELSLAGRESRERTRFVDTCIPRISETEKQRMELVMKFVKKDKDDKPVMIGEGTKASFDISDKDKEAFDKEFNELMDEEFVIDILEGNKAKVKTVKELLLNTDYQFGPKDADSLEDKVNNIRKANEYVVWCDAFEKVEV